MLDSLVQTRLLTYTEGEIAFSHSFGNGWRVHIIDGFMIISLFVDFHMFGFIWCFASVMLLELGLSLFQVCYPIRRGIGKDETKVGTKGL